jgi:hypothetical protein
MDVIEFRRRIIERQISLTHASGPVYGAEPHYFAGAAAGAGHPLVIGFVVSAVIATSAQ